VEKVKGKIAKKGRAIGIKAGTAFKSSAPAC
jgi:hypothetical protein